MSEFSIGTLLSIPCKVSEGPMLSEKVISCNIDTQPPIEIEGVVPSDLTKEQRVIAAVSGINKNYVSLVFNGEMFRAKNPIKIPMYWITQNAEIVSNE